MDAADDLATLRPLDGPGTRRPDGGFELVELDRDHPGFRDALYRRRRNEIAELAWAYRDGDPVPDVEYTDVEHGVWRTVWRELAPVHRTHACRRFRETLATLDLDFERIPQLSAINRMLETRGGIRFMPVAGLVSARAFLEYLGRGVFLSTQYIRHASQPLYTPEPDVVHELIGHAVTLADPFFARLNRLFGDAALRATDEAALVRISRLYWYTVEFGAVREDGEVRAYGAGLLSSFGELGRFGTHAELRPLDPDAAMARPYDPTDYQRVVFVAPSLDGVARTVEAALAREFGA